MWKDFKNFMLRGNVVDLAVAVVIAGAFGKIVASFVKDIIMPPIGLMLGDVDFKDLKWILKEGQEAITENGEVVKETVDAVAINYGMFIMTIIDFVIIAFAIFMLVRAYMKSQKKKEDAPPPGPTKEEVLLAEIRDAVKELNK